MMQCEALFISEIESENVLDTVRCLRVWRWGVYSDTCAANKK